MTTSRSSAHPRGAAHRTRAPRSRSCRCLVARAAQPTAAQKSFEKLRRVFARRFSLRVPPRGAQKFGGVAAAGREISDLHPRLDVEEREQKFRLFSSCVEREIICAAIRRIQDRECCRRCHVDGDRRDHQRRPTRPAMIPTPDAALLAPAFGALAVDALRRCGVFHGARGIRGRGRILRAPPQADAPTKEKRE